MTKVTLDPHMWAVVCVRGRKQVYAKILLRTQLGFQKHKK